MEKQSLSDYGPGGAPPPTLGGVRDPPGPFTPGGLGGSGMEGSGVTVGVEESNGKVDVVNEFKSAPTFSARTCLDLLPFLTEEQIDYEIKHFSAIDPTLGLLRTRFPNIDTKRDLLSKSLTKSLCKEVTKIVENFDQITLNISYALHKANKHIAEVEKIYSPLTDIQPADSSEPANSPDPAPRPAEVTLPDPVCTLDFMFEDITMDSVSNSFVFDTKLSGNRDVVYFGTTEYKYGRHKHPPAPYPDSPIFDNIFDKISSIDKTFTRENFSCMATRYPNGYSSIPIHQDDESSIVPGSLIYTVSFGAERTLNFQSVLGRVQEHSLKLTHGMVYTMSHESQSFWSHRIDREPEVTGPRVSLTFRHMITTDERPTTDRHVPPVAQPFDDTADNTKRILFLTDSIFSSCPATVLSTVPNHKCIKKLNFQLSDVFQFEPEFSYSDIVILSSGVNDLSRYNHTATSLADTVCARLSRCCRNNPKTKFIFNSILETKFSWLNREISLFNDMMYRFCHSLPNVTYFDSHSILCDSSIPRVWEPKGNGIHITLRAKQCVTRELVKCIAFVTGFRTTELPGKRRTQGDSYADPMGSYRTEDAE